MSQPTPPKPPLPRRHPAVWGAAIALGLLLLAALAYAGTRHIIPEQTVISIGGLPVHASWTEVEPLDEGLGFITSPPLITNVEVRTGEDETEPLQTGRYHVTSVGAAGVRSVQFEPGPYRELEELTLSRVVENVLGAEVLRWSCRIGGAISSRSEVHVSLTPSGEGDAGYTIRLDGQLVGAETLVLTVTEQLWSEPARSCRLQFSIGADGSLKPLLGGKVGKRP